MKQEITIQTTKHIEQTFYTTNKNSGNKKYPMTQEKTQNQ